VELEMASGETREVMIDVRTRLFLSAVGYTADSAGKEPGRNRHDLTDTATRAALEGQTDNGSVFAVDGVEGHGYVETGLGVHARYRRD
jgi:hypothetical protein